MDAQTNLRHKNESGSLASIKYLIFIANTTHIEHWICAIGSNDSIVTNAIAIKTLNDESIESGFAFTSPGSFDSITNYSDLITEDHEHHMRGMIAMLER